MAQPACCAHVVRVCARVILVAFDIVEVPARVSELVVFKIVVVVSFEEAKDSSIGNNWRVAFKVCNPDGLELLDEHGFEDGHWNLVQSRQKLALLRLVGPCNEDRIVEEVADRWGNDVERREVFGVRRLEVHQHNDVDESHVDLALQHRVEALEVRARRTHKTRASDVAVAISAAGVESAFLGYVPLLGKRHESTVNQIKVALTVAGRRPLPAPLRVPRLGATVRATWSSRCSPACCVVALPKDAGTVK